KDLGDLALAQRCFDAGLAMKRREQDVANLSMGFQNAAHLQMLVGHLPASASCATEALALAQRGDHSSFVEFSSAYIACASGLMGCLRDAHDRFAEATRIEGEPLYSMGGIWEAEFRLRLGDRDAARAQSLRNLATCQKYRWFRDVARVHTV